MWPSLPTPLIAIEKSHDIKGLHAVNLVYESPWALITRQPPLKHYPLYYGADLHFVSPEPASLYAAETRAGKWGQNSETKATENETNTQILCMQKFYGDWWLTEVFFSKIRCADQYLHVI